MASVPLLAETQVDGTKSGDDLASWMGIPIQHMFLMQMTTNVCSEEMLNINVGKSDRTSLRGDSRFATRQSNG